MDKKENLNVNNKIELKALKAIFEKFEFSLSTKK